MTDSREEAEWRRLLERLQGGEGPEQQDGVAPMFDEATARQRVGVLITKAMLGESLYERYRLNCGDSTLL
jgi:hypothetical protein